MQAAAHIVAVTMLMVGQSSSDETPRAGVAEIRRAVVTLKDYVHIPAMQPGVLAKLELADGTPLTEGVEVEKDQLLGKLDDKDAVARKRATELEQRVAESEHEKAEVSIEVSEKTTAVYKAEVVESADVNRRSPGAIPETQMRRQRFQVERGLADEKAARADAISSRLTAELRDAQVDVASINLEKHYIKSPIDGEVVQVYRKPGEWVSAGDPIVRIVHLERLRVEGFLKIDKYLRHQVVGQPVTVRVRLPGGIVEFKSTVSYASPLVQASGDFRVICEVANKRVNGEWVMLPGMDAQMEIEVKPPQIAIAD